MCTDQWVLTSKYNVKSSPLTRYRIFPQKIPSIALCSQSHSRWPLIWTISLFVSFTCFQISINGFTQHTLFCACLSLSVIFSRCIYVVLRISFVFVLLLSIILSCEYTTFCLSFTCVDIWVVYNLCLLWIKPFWTLVYRSFGGHVFYFERMGDRYL